VLDDHEVLAGCHVGSDSLVDFLLEASVVVDTLGVNPRVVLAHDPDLDTLGRLSLCNAADVELVTLGDGGLGGHCGNERLPYDDGDGGILCVGEVVLVRGGSHCVHGVGTCVDVQVSCLPLVLEGVVVKDISGGEAACDSVHDTLSRLGEFTTLSGEVRAGDEQVDSVSLGVGSGQLDLLSQEVARIACGDNGHGSLLDLNVNFVGLVLVCVEVVAPGCISDCGCTGAPLYTEGVLLVLGIL